MPSRAPLCYDCQGSGGFPGHCKTCDGFGRIRMEIPPDALLSELNERERREPYWLLNFDCPALRLARETLARTNALSGS